MADLLELSIVTPERQVVVDRVDQVNVPGIEGDLGVLYDHAPLITTLRPGILSYEKVKEGESDREVIHLVVSGGYMEVAENRVTVLAETAEFIDKIDRTRAESAKIKAEQLLAKSDLSEDEFREAQKKLFRAVARLEGGQDKE